MAASFDPAKLAEALSRYGTETRDTLSNLEKSQKLEQDMVNLAKQLGQIYKTNNDQFKESLKGKTLEEKITAKLERSNEEIKKFESARLNSTLNIATNKDIISSVEAQISAHNAGILNLTRDQLKEAQEQIAKKKQEVLIEERLLAQSKQQLDLKRKTNSFLKVQKEILDGINKTVDFTIKSLNKAGDAANNLASKLNIPTSFSGVVDKLFATFNAIDSAATSVRQKFGLLRSEGEIFEKNVRQVATELADFGVTAEQAGTTMKDIGSTFTALQAAEKSLVKDVSLMSAQFGIASATSAKFLQTMSGITGKSAMANKNMMGFAKMAATAYGVGLEDVMNDVAHASDEARMFAGKNANEMVRAAAQARQMGTTLDNMAKTAKGLLDFESSIQHELKASALIGKNINFNEARRLAFQGKVVEANKLILDQAKKIKFNQLNPIAQEAFAQAAGKSVKELQDMMGAEQNLNAALKSQDAGVRELAEKRKKMAQTMEKGSAAEKAAQQKAFEEGMKREHNQERIKTIQNQINQLFMELAGPILEAMGPILEHVVNYLKENKEQVKATAMEIGKWFVAVKSFAVIFSSNVTGPIGSTLTTVGKITNGLFRMSAATNKFAGGAIQAFGNWNKISKNLPLVSKGINLLGSGVKGIGTVVGTVGKGISSLFSGIGGFFTRASGSVGLISKIGPLFGAVSKFLGPIGLVITVIQGATAFIKAFTTTTGTFSDKIKAGLKGVFETVILEPLKTVWDLIKKIPGLLASIDFGSIFKDVTTYLLNALTSLPEMIEKLFSGKGGGGGIQWGKIFMNIGNLLFQMIMFNVIKLPFAIITVIGKLGLMLLKVLPGLLLDSFISLFIKLPALTLKYFIKGILSFVDWVKGYNWKNVGTDILNGLTSVLSGLKKIGGFILEGIVAVGSAIKDSIINSFKGAWEWLKETFMGKSPSLLGLSIVNGIKSVAGLLFESITYPFKKAQEFLSQIFNNIKMVLTEVGSFFKNVFSAAFDFVINGLGKIVDKIKGIGGTVLKLAGKGVSFISGIFGGNEEKKTEEKSAGKTEPVKNELVDAIVNSNRLVVERLETLTNLMTSGQIAVYIDGQKANQLLAASSTKFGSLGQATTF